MVSYDTHSKEALLPIDSQPSITEQPRPFGLPDEQFAHLDGRARMITKAPIRLLTLQALELIRMLGVEIKG